MRSLAYFDERAAAGERFVIVCFEQRALVVLRLLQYTSNTPTDRLAVCGIGDNRYLSLPGQDNFTPPTYLFIM